METTDSTSRTMSGRSRLSGWCGPLRLAAIAGLLSLGLAVSAIAAGSPSAGRYKSAGKISFRFRLAKGFCYLAPKNLHNYRAARGRGGTGLCFASASVVPVHLNCVGGGSIHGFTVDFSIFGTRLRLTGNRTLHVKAYTYGSPVAPIGFTELDLAFAGARATGFVRATTTIGSGGCDSGTLRFSARPG